MAGLIGTTSDAEHYRALAARARSAWQPEFVSGDGAVTPATQANLTRALAFGLVDGHHRERVASDLVTPIRAAGTRLGTGFLVTPFLLPVLADTGHIDVAYDLLLQTSPPSWLHMIDAGVATIWENWEGLDARGLGSLNHHSKGAVVSFLHEYFAGCGRSETYRRFGIRPCPGGGITAAEARLYTPYGPISASWRIADHTFTLDIQVAPGTQANNSLPDGSTETRGPGIHRFTASLR